MRPSFTGFKITICLFFIVFFIHPLLLTRADLPECLDLGSYARYEQCFSTGEVHELFWNISFANTSVVEITVRSHGIERNQTTEVLSVVPGGGTMLIERNSWMITRLMTATGTQDSGTPIEEKVPFWIPASVNESTPIDTVYDNNAYPASETLTLSSFSLSRDCWVTKNIYSPGNSMERWHDKEMGIVLKIRTNITFMTSKMIILETLNATNIISLTGDPSGAVSPSLQGFEVLTGILVSCTLARHFQRKPR